MPLLLKSLGQLVDVVDLVDRHAVVREVQHLVVEIRVGVPLGPHDFLDAVVAPARPAVRRKHDVGIDAKADDIERQHLHLADLAGPAAAAQPGHVVAHHVRGPVGQPPHLFGVQVELVHVLPTLMACSRGA